MFLNPILPPASMPGLERILKPIAGALLEENWGRAESLLRETAGEAYPVCQKRGHSAHLPVNRKGIAVLRALYGPQPALSLFFLNPLPVAIQPKYDGSQWVAGRLSRSYSHPFWRFSANGGQGPDLDIMGNRLLSISYKAENLSTLPDIRLLASELGYLPFEFRKGIHIHRKAYK